MAARAQCSLKSTRSQPQNVVCRACCAKPVVNVDYGHPAAAAIQHAKQGGQASETRSVADARRNRYDRFVDKSRHHTGKRSFHTGRNDKHPAGADAIRLRDTR